MRPFSVSINKDVHFAPHLLPYLSHWPQEADLSVKILCILQSGFNKNYELTFYGIIILYLE